MNDQDYMRLARDLAKKGQGRTSSNPMVGAVIVKGKRIIGRGWHKKFGGPHAEILALRQAGRRAEGAKLYVTLEPCFHFGKTPPCVDDVIASGVKEVVIGMVDPNPLTKGKSIRKLRRCGVRVKTGILQKDLAQLNESFLKFIQEKRPFIVAKIAQTLDGKVATFCGQSQWITSQKTRCFTRKLRDDFDAILVGIQTVLKDNPRLTGVRKTKRLKKIILDSSLRISLTARLFQGVLPGQCIVATTKKAPARKITILRRRGVDVIVCPAKAGRVDLSWLLKRLAEKHIGSVLIEGGPRVIGRAFQEKLVDKVHFFIAPKILGDTRALSSVNARTVAHVRECWRLSDCAARKIGEDFFIEGYPRG